MQRVAMIELLPGDELIPGVLSDQFGKISAQRLTGNLCLTQVEHDHPLLQDAINSYPKRIAIGAVDIWNTFPEARLCFRVIVERMKISGTIVYEMNLGDVVVGDRIIEYRVFLYDVFALKRDPLGFSIKEIIDTSQIDFGEFLFLFDKKSIYKKHSINGMTLLFCRLFSISDMQICNLFPGIDYLNTRELIESTDYMELINKNAGAEINFPAKQPNFNNATLGEMLPWDVGGAFIVDENIIKNVEFRDAIIGRILAAAAISAGLSGQIVAELKMTYTPDCEDIAFKPRMDEHWNRSYANHNTPWRNFISFNNLLFNNIINIIRYSTESKYIKASDDFRLTAIDIVEDSRHSRTPAVIYAQLWMGLERLISSKTETSVQLSMALCALFPASERIDQFKCIKQSYDHRSRIVHGYDFIRNTKLNIDGGELARIFRYLLIYSLTKNFKNNSEFRNHLIEYVISGASSAIFDESTVFGECDDNPRQRRFTE